MAAIPGILKLGARLRELETKKKYLEEDIYNIDRKRRMVPKEDKLGFFQLSTLETRKQDNKRKINNIDELLKLITEVDELESKISRLIISLKEKGGLVDIDSIKGKYDSVQNGIGGIDALVNPVEFIGENFNHLHQELITKSKEELDTILKNYELLPHVIERREAAAAADKARTNELRTGRLSRTVNRLFGQRQRGRGRTIKRKGSMGKSKPVKASKSKKAKKSIKNKSKKVKRNSNKIN